MRTIRGSTRHTPVSTRQAATNGGLSTSKVAASTPDVSTSPPTPAGAAAVRRSFSVIWMTTLS